MGEGEGEGAKKREELTSSFSRRVFVSSFVLSFATDWRRPSTPPSEYTSSTPKEIEDYATYVRIISWFMDDPLPHAPFSVHRMALVGKQLGKEVGEWFGPSTAAGAIRFVLLLILSSSSRTCIVADLAFALVFVRNL